VLYATDRDGREVKLVGTDSSLDEGVPLDLGMPSMGPDGTVFFGAAFRRDNQVRWEIFAASPDQHSLSRVVLSRMAPKLEMISDPTPLALSDGSIVFAAREFLHGEGLYLLKEGKLSCLVRVGANVDGDRVLKNIAFGSLSAARGGTVALVGYLTPVGKVELLFTHRKVTVLAAVGSNAPDGAKYRDLGPPTVRDENVVFPAITDRGEEVYAYRRGKVDRLLATGSPCASGKITYISQDRLGLDSAGTVVVGATCSGSPAIVMVRRSQVTVLAIVTNDHNGFRDLSVPTLLETGTVLFGGSKTNESGLYSAHLYFGSSVAATVRPLISATDSSVPLLHSILAVSVAGNEGGRLAYLGGPVESLASVPVE